MQEQRFLHSWIAAASLSIGVFVLTLVFLFTEGGLCSLAEDVAKTEPAWIVESPAIGSALYVPSLCDVTIHSITAGTYAMALAPYARDEMELCYLPGIKVWNGSPDEAPIRLKGGERYKFLNNGKLEGYADLYVAINRARKASSEEYRLLDIRASVLNRQREPLDIKKEVSAQLCYEETYPFKCDVICVEGADVAGSSAEWLLEAELIPPLLYRTVHFIFEVPAVVATGEEALEMLMKIGEEEWHVQLR